VTAKDRYIDTDGDDKNYSINILPVVAAKVILGLIISRDLTSYDNDGQCL